jgi:hypothetical protein
MLIFHKKYTVAPALTAAVFLIAISFSSDHFRERGFHMALPVIISLIGYVILVAKDITVYKAVGYFAIFLCTIGVSAGLFPW